MTAAACPLVTPNVPEPEPGRTTGAGLGCKPSEPLPSLLYSARRASVGLILEAYLAGM